MSDSNSVRLSYAIESTFGTTPASALQILRFTSETLAGVQQTVNSNEIRDDGQMTDVKRTDFSASGAINGELSYGTYDDFLALLLKAPSWSSAVVVTGSIDAVASGNKFTGTGFGSLAANQWIYVTGFTNTANNGFFKIVSRTSTEVVVSGGTLTNETGSGIRLNMGAQIVNGTTQRSLSIERKYGDVANTFAAYRGAVVDQGTFTAALKQITNVSFNVMAKSEASATATIGGGTYTSATTSDVHAATDEIKGVFEGLAQLCAQNYNFTVNDNVRARNCLGVPGVSSFGYGTIAATGTLQAYFTSRALMDKYLNQVATGMAIGSVDSAGNGYLFEFPRVKLTAGKANASGINTDVMSDVNFTAFMHPTELITIRIAKFAGA